MFNKQQNSFVKQSENKSVFSLKNGAIAVLLGLTATCGTYLLQQSEKQPAPQVVMDEATSLNAKEPEEEITFIGEITPEDKIGFEAEKPVLDLDMPYFDFDPEAEAQAQIDRILNDDLTEFKMKHGIIHEMEYDTTEPPDLFRNGNECTSQERARIGRSMAHTLETVKQAIANPNSEAWKLWFGDEDTRQADWMIKTRISNTYNFMKEKYLKIWNVACCHNTRGSCDGCGGTTLAYVAGYTARDGKKETMAWMRMCPKMFETEMDEAIGLTLFHELQHMTSVVTDDPEYPYAKKGLAKLAKYYPVRARLNANSYTMYVAQAGMSHKDFVKFTGLWGGHVENHQCADEYNNCPELAEGCCFDRRVSSGYMYDSCCGSCKHLMKTDSKCTDEYYNCFDKYSNCAELATSEWACQRNGMAKDCCASCRKIETTGPPQRTDGKQCADKMGDCKSYVERYDCNKKYNFSVGPKKLNEVCCNSCLPGEDKEQKVTPPSIPSIPDIPSTPSTPSGGDSSCQDNFSNCDLLAQNKICSSNSYLINGKNLEKQCCKSCKTHPDHKKCINRYTNCNDLVSQVGCEHTGTQWSRLADVCCESCR